MTANAIDAELLQLARSVPQDALNDLIDSLPLSVVSELAAALARDAAQTHAATPLQLAQQLYGEAFNIRPHIEYLSQQIVTAVDDVKRGENRMIMVHMPPRTGKTTTTTLITPAWLMSQQPGWPIALTSYDGALARTWGRQIRRWAESGALGAQVSIAPDAGAVGEWETTAGGRLMSMSIREPFTGRGAKVLIIDDPHKNSLEAHSQIMRDSVWDWYQSVALTRLEPPYLVIVTQTRWHEDDLSGRLLSAERDGRPDDWQVISLPAIARENDTIGRAVGEPLLSPLRDETRDAALQRWQQLRQAVGSYNWAALFDQRPAPARGAIFDMDKWRYWTANPANATDDRRVVYVEPRRDLAGATWLDSWDAAFKGEATSDYVVGQRWARKDGDRYLIAQQRSRMTFTETIAAMRRWAATNDDAISPLGDLVHLRLIEERANGAAAIDTLRREIAGIRATNPTRSKVERARTVTPEIESGNVYLPLPTDAGNEWVGELLDELRQFPHGAHDDQVDALTQALTALRVPQGGQITVPGRSGTAAPLRRRIPGR